jgi:hypothetical protein
MAFIPRTSRRINPEKLIELRAKLRQRAIDEHEARLKQFPWPSYTDGYHPNPVPFPEYPGYYRIPIMTDFLIINEKGHVIRFTTGKEVKQKPTSKGYPAISVRLDVGKSWPYLIHRILAMMFVPVPARHLDKSRDELQVNHIDGVKTNYALDNLEWTTAAENIEHMLEFIRPDHQIPTMAKHLQTNEIREYPSVKDCAIDHMLSKVSIRAHILSESAGRLAIDGWVFKKNDGSPWPIFIAHPDSRQTLTASCDVVARNDELGLLHLFTTLTEACEILKFKRGDLTNHRNRKGTAAPFHGWVFYPFSDECFKRSPTKEK